jgi:hypothetical protein
MQRKSDLTKEIDTLDMMINALGVELAEQLDCNLQTDETRKLIAEIETAIDEMRFARGVRKMLLIALAGSDVVEKRNNNRVSRKSSVRLSPAA